METLNMQGRVNQRREVSTIEVFHTENNTLLFPVYNYFLFNAEKVNNSVGKRVLDIFISLLLTVTVFIWLFPIIALLIKLTARGPVFFCQQRSGLNGAVFKCYKFRSMELECSNEDITGKYLQAIKKDPRITVIGRFLRKTSLDELPQFINVIKGEMCIVGPRPHPKQLDNECMGIIKNYHLRFSIKPGITGMAQVKGFRGGTPEHWQMQKRIEHDIRYIENWNLLLDLKIIMLTFYCLIARNENAY